MYGRSVLRPVQIFLQQLQRRPHLHRADHVPQGQAEKSAAQEPHEEQDPGRGAPLQIHSLTPLSVMFHSLSPIENILLFPSPCGGGSKAENALLFPPPAGEGARERVGGLWSHPTTGREANFTRGRFSLPRKIFSAHKICAPWRGMLGPA